MKTSSSNITYKGVDMYVEFNYSEYRPAVYYLSNGDPGYPAEGGESRHRSPYCRVEAGNGYE